MDSGSLRDQNPPRGALALGFPGLHTQSVACAYAFVHNRLDSHDRGPGSHPVRPRRTPGESVPGETCSCRACGAPPRCSLGLRTLRDDWNNRLSEDQWTGLLVCRPRPRVAVGFAFGHLWCHPICGAKGREILGKQRPAAGNGAGCARSAFCAGLGRAPLFSRSDVRHLVPQNAGARLPACCSLQLLVLRLCNQVSRELHDLCIRIPSDAPRLAHHHVGTAECHGDEVLVEQCGLGKGCAGVGLAVVHDLLPLLC
mmetsp:Transcript_42530/g.99165  ORF Transcript_42530/g.99165 Transcript_42530/m.99165 type:complete len:255 (+) Transcript_42530:407-1171(+)